MTLNMYPEEDIAHVAYEGMRTYAEIVGEMFHPAWGKASDIERACAMNCACFILDNPGVAVEDVHNDWVKRKTEGGWQFGPVKDVSKMEHPSMVSYEQLNPIQKAKILIFSRLVEVMA